MPTMSSGKTSRMPNTAMSTPMVRKMRCQNGLIRSSTVALTTALSNDSEISRMPRMAQRTSPVTPPYRNATTSDTSVTAYERPNIRRFMSSFSGSPVETRCPVCPDSPRRAGPGGSHPVRAALRRPYAALGRADRVDGQVSGGGAAVLEPGGAGAPDHLPAGAVEAAHPVLDVAVDGGPGHVDGAVGGAHGQYACGGGRSERDGRGVGTGLG